MSVAAGVRRVLFWSHLAVGVATGLVILVLSATGVALTYEHQLLEWAALRGAATAAAAEGPALPIDTLVARVEASAPGRQVAGLTVRSEPGAPVTLSLKSRQSLYVDPATGAVIGSDSTARAAMTQIVRVHRSLATGEGVRDALGASITGAANLAFFFLLLTGAYLWWPRRWSPQAFRAVIVPVWRARGKVRDWNWHHAAAFWTAPALFVVVLSGVFISYRWPTAALEAATGGAEARPEGRADGGRAEGGRTEGGRERRKQEGAQRAPFGPMLAQATAGVPGWRIAQVRPGREAGAPVTVMVTTGDALLRPDRRTQFTFDAASGEPGRRRAYADTPPAQRVRAWMRGLHTGEALGFWGQTFAGLASLAGVVLVWTGLSLSLRRLRGWLARDARSAARGTDAAGPDRERTADLTAA